MLVDPKHSYSPSQLSRWPSIDWAMTHYNDAISEAEDKCCARRLAALRLRRYNEDGAQNKAAVRERRINDAWPDSIKHPEGTRRASSGHPPGKQQRCMICR